MATNAEIAAALSGLNISPLDNPYGLGANTIAKALPNLYNPYASVGTNIGVTLGGALLAGLLGYQAKKQATEASLVANQYATQMLAKTPEERLGLIQNLPEDVSSRTQIQNALLGLNTQLLGQQNALDLLGGQEVAKQKALAGYYATPEGQNAFEKELERIKAESLAKYAGLNDMYGTKTVGAKSLPSGVQERIAESSLFADTAQKHLDKIKEMSPAQLKTLLTTGSSFFGTVGEPGFLSENEAILQQYRKANFGASLTKNEQRAADIISGKQLTASKADIEHAWQTLIDLNKQRAIRTLEVGIKSPEELKQQFLAPPLEESPAQKRNRELKERLANLEKLMGQTGK